MSDVILPIPPAARAADGWTAMQVSTLAHALTGTVSMNLYVTLQDLVRWRHPLHQRTLGSRQHSRRTGSGQTRSRRRGRGMEFAEVRPYQPGDEIRYMDWKVTARTLKPHTKVFTESHEQPVHLIIDQTAAGFFASQGTLKAGQVLHAAAILGWLTLQRQERIGGICFNESEHYRQAPGRGETALLQLLKQALILHRQLRQPGARQPTRWRQLLEQQRSLLYPGDRLFLIGDLMALDETTLKSLSTLARHHDITAIHCYDPLEMQLPALGPVQVSDGRHILTVDTHDPALQRAYVQTAEAALNRLRERLYGSGIPLIQLSTHDDPLVQLQQQRVIT